MQCPTCGDYGDLVLVRVKRTGEHVIACTECDLLWLTVDAECISADSATDVTTFLEEKGLRPSWDELEVVKRL
jgi:formate dehydrogenase maturation protein FdhE